MASFLAPVPHMRRSIQFIAAALALLTLMSPVSARRRDQAWRSHSVKFANRDFERQVNLADPVGNTFSTIQDSKYSVLLIDNQHFWNLGDEVSLHIDVPYLIAFAQGNVNVGGNLQHFEDTVTGLRDIVITPTYWLVDPDAPQGGHNISLQLRLKTGTKRLSTNEQQVLTFIREGGLSVLNSFGQFASSVQTLFSGGTEFTLSNNWSWRLSDRQSFDFAAGYNYSGRYSPNENFPTIVNPYDWTHFRGVYSTSPHRRLRHSVGLDTSFFTSGTIENPRNDNAQEQTPAARSSLDLRNSFVKGKRPDLQREAAWNLFYSRSSVHSHRSASSWTTSYVHSGEQDVITSDGGVIRRVRPGDYASIGYNFTQKASSGFLLNYGFDLGHIAKSRAPQVDLGDDTQRFLATTKLGAKRSTHSGHSYGADFQIGLNKDTPRLVANASYTFAW